MESKNSINILLNISTLYIQNFDPLTLLGINCSDLKILEHKTVKLQFRIKIRSEKNIIEKIKLTISAEFLFHKLFNLKDDRFTDQTDVQLRSKGMTLFQFQPQTIHDYTLLGNKNKLQESMKEGRNALFEIDQIERGRTLLYIAARSGYIEICNLLIQSGASLDIKSAGGSTALHAGSFFGHQNVVQMITFNGCDLDITNDSKNTAYEQAYDKEIQDVIKEAQLCKIISMIRKLRQADFIFSTKNIYHNKDQNIHIGIQLMLNPQKLPKNQQKSYENAYFNWIPVYHGTHQVNLESIITNGLIPPGQQTKQGKIIQVGQRHIPIDVECLGYKNFAVGVFTSPSLWYSANYGETIYDLKNKPWDLVFNCFIKPNCYNEIPNTTVGYIPQKGENEKKLEYRIPSENLTTESSSDDDEQFSNIVLKSVFLINQTYLKNNLISTDDLKKHITPHHLQQYDDIFLVSKAINISLDDVESIVHLKEELNC